MYRIYDTGNIVTLSIYQRDWSPTGTTFKSSQFQALFWRVCFVSVWVITSWITHGFLHRLLLFPLWPEKHSLGFIFVACLFLVGRKFHKITFTLTSVHMRTFCDGKLVMLLTHQTHPKEEKTRFKTLLRTRKHKPYYAFTIHVQWSCAIINSCDNDSRQFSVIFDSAPNPMPNCVHVHTFALQNLHDMCFTIIHHLTLPSRFCRYM